MGALKKRYVFYVMGFDPRGPDFYHAMLKREARIAKKRELEQVEVGKLQTTWAHGVRCECRSTDAPQLEISYEFLSITDIIECYFRKSILWSLAQAIRLLPIMLFSGFLARNFRCSPKFALFTLYPFFLIFLVIALSLFAGCTANSMDWGLGAACGISLALFVLLMCWMRNNEHRHYLFYLLGDFVFSHAVVTGLHAEMAARMRDFVDRVLSVLGSAREECEILIVGHSSGALLAIELAAAVAREADEATRRKIALLTLGSQSSLGFFPATLKFSQNVAYLAERPEITWRDIFAPQDVISSGRFDPIAELTQATNRGGFSLHSARFKEALLPDTYAKMQFNFFRLHMQYLRARERNCGFSYLSVISSSKQLAETAL